MATHLIGTSGHTLLSVGETLVANAQPVAGGGAGMCEALACHPLGELDPSLFLSVASWLAN